MCDDEAHGYGLQLQRPDSRYKALGIRQSMRRAANVVWKRDWTLYCHHMKLLRIVQRRHLRSALKIKWDHYITNGEVLNRAKSADFEVTLIKNRLHWIGRVVRMPEERPLKALLYGELAYDSRKIGRPLLWY